jgi:hypothetical protein
VQLGTTGDPSKMERFRPNLTELEPLFDYDKKVITTLTGEPHCIVHQYDRVPIWQSLVRNMFNQEDPNQFFTFRTA